MKNILEIFPNIISNTYKFGYANNTSHNIWFVIFCEFVKGLRGGIGVYFLYLLMKILSSKAIQVLIIIQ